ncbi:ThuA domain-containing protein [bacterium]|nr:ThuA domain-containing protein [bacterium]
MLRLHTFPTLLITILMGWLSANDAQAENDKKIVLIAGPPSHGVLQHEHKAGCMLIEHCLQGRPGIELKVYTGGWPENPDALEGADAVIIFCTGGKNHLAIQENRLAQLEKVMQTGAGFGCLHYGVEVPRDQGGAEFLKWMGGYFETHWSVNPHWQAEFKAFPEHPISNGVKPFGVNDEWYFHMRFPEGMEGVTPILSAHPPKETMKRGDGPHSGNPAVREAVAQGQPQHVAWAYERPEGGRGFGFTGLHNHLNWRNPSFRKVILNAVLWIAQAEVPSNGVDCPLTEEMILSNLDQKRGRNPLEVLRDARKNQPFLSPVQGK